MNTFARHFYPLIQSCCCLLITDLPVSFSLDSDIVHPVRVDEHGSFLTFDLTPRNLQKRGLSSGSVPTTFYGIKYQGVELTFNLSQNHQLLAPGYVSEWRNGGLRETRLVSRPSNSCHMQGGVQTDHQFVGNAAISICSGLVRTDSLYFSLILNNFLFSFLVIQYNTK